MINRLFLTLTTALLLSGCTLFAAPAMTPTQTPLPTATLTPTMTASPTRTPSLTSTPTITLTPSQTLTPSITPTSTNTLFPTIAPEPTIRPAGDNNTIVTLDKDVKNTIGKVALSFINTSDKSTQVTPGTPAAASELETVYLVDPITGMRLRVVDLPSTTGARVYWSPDGAYLAYFVESGFAAGLYVLNLNTGVATRVLALTSLNPRGIPSEPIWSPDSKRLAITLPTPYDLDIYTVAPDGTNLRDVTSSGSYDFFPVWSPDGQYLAFVSDRAMCPSWEPNAPRSCYKPGALPIDSGIFGGGLYVVDMGAQDSSPRQLSDKWISVPPHWISRDSLAFISSVSPTDSSVGSILWYVDLRSDSVHRISDENPNGASIFGDNWSSDGNRVVYQEIQSTTHVVMRDASGNEVARSTEALNFPRYAFAAAWSPDNHRVVIGGAHNQCPYGMFVIDEDFKTQVTSPPNPGVCNPLWSPDGKWIAFGGTTASGSGTDGRYDIYVAEASGYGARAVSTRLGGQIALLGWVGGR
ncbi:MAG TPA: hypothetical protein VMT34_12945 [Aggregatilineales bacterium]|nr:hypothetical protein [Aggregatilineales bacterium]